MSRKNNIKKLNGVEMFQKILDTYSVPLYTVITVNDILHHDRKVDDITKTILRDMNLMCEGGNLTSRAISLMDDLDALFIKRKAAKVKKESIDMEMVKEYVEIFPDIKLGTGKNARANIKELATNFDRFFTTYPEHLNNWELIFKATRLYVYEYEQKNYEYMRTSYYFIRKQRDDKSYISDLATYIDRILNGESVESTSLPKFNTRIV